MENVLKRKVNSDRDLSHWKKCNAHIKIEKIFLLLNESIRSKERRFNIPSSNSTILKILDILNEVEHILSVTPPVEQQCCFSNRGFVNFYRKISENRKTLFKDLTDNEEVIEYFLASFGNPIRVDLGTGNELNFLAFITALFELNMFNTKYDENINITNNENERKTHTGKGVEKEDEKEDEGKNQDHTHNEIQDKNEPRNQDKSMNGNGNIKSNLNECENNNLDENEVKVCEEIVFIVFWKYWDILISIQRAYRLEPAGTHGSWGIDDFVCLPFVFGSSQLIGNSCGISPLNVVVADTALLNRDKFSYCKWIDYLYSSKSGPFSQHSRLLFSLTKIDSFDAIFNGMNKMFIAEVLDKFVIVQQFGFGSVLNWDCITSVNGENLS